MALHGLLPDTELPVTRYESLINPCNDRITYLPEVSNAPVRRFFTGRGIRKTGMDCLLNPKEWAGLVFTVTNLDNNIYSCRKELIHPLGPLSIYINPDLVHHSDGNRVHTPEVISRTCSFE